ncbi:unnamed protein product, partial [Sphacelaria rigidula]
YCRVLLDLSNGPSSSPTNKTIAAFTETATSHTITTAVIPDASPITTKSDRIRSAPHDVIGERGSSGTTDDDAVIKPLAASGAADGAAAGRAIFPEHDRCSTYPDIAHLREALERMYDG